MSQKKTHTSTTELQELYNTLMYTIEPELMTDMLPMLDAIYKDETKENRAIRLAWYAEAFEMFAEHFSKFMGIWKHEIAAVRRTALALKEQGDQDDLSNLEHSIQES